MPDTQITSEKEDMALKLSLEAGLIVLVGRLFRQIAVDYRNVYSITGQILNAGIYTPDLIGVLRNTYRKAGKKAGRELRNEVDIVSPNSEEASSLTDINLSEFANSDPVERADIITQTTNRKLNAFTLQAIISSAILGIFPTNQEVAQNVSQRFTQNSKGRSKNIAVTETLNAVEGSRLIEINTLSQEDVEIKPKKKDEPPKRLIGSLSRRWDSRGDKHVRPTHVIADGQIVPGTGTPFVVGNSLLLYPGDTSLDAEIKEIAGCRCFAATLIR